jgi:hypothetical protein
VAQAAAWHITDGISWQVLAAKVIDHAGGTPDEPYFQQAELAAAVRLVQYAEQVAAERPAAVPSTGG